MDLKDCLLGDVVTFQRGHDLPKAQMVDGPYPVLGSNGIIGYHNRYTTTGPVIVVGRSGNVGHPFMVKSNAWAHNTSLYIKDFKGNDPIFIYYFLQTLNLAKFAGGSAVPTLNRNHINTIEVKIPKDVSVQKKIGSILASFDEKISTNNKINDNLEAQALALFNELYSKSNQEVLYIDQIQILGGGTPKTGESSFWNGEIPFFTPKDAKFSYTICTEKKLTTEGLSHCNSQLYPKNTVFVTARGTVGKVSMAGVPMAMNQSCYALIGKCIPQLLVYFYTQKIIRNLKNKANGAVFDAITTRDFEYETVMKFSDDLLNKFNAKVEPIYIPYTKQSSRKSTANIFAE